MHFIEHIIEPTSLLLAWQSSDERHEHARFIVAELNRIGEEITLTYWPKTSDFIEAQKLGFKPYPAFPETDKIYTNNVIDAFMRRLPPRKRGDFPQYLEGLRLKSDMQMSDFALLGYSGAKLLSDGFSIIHPFDEVTGPCELLLEVARYQPIHQQGQADIQVGNPAVLVLVEGFSSVFKEKILIEVNDQHIGYVNRALSLTFQEWIIHKRIKGAWVEKLNGTPGRPAVYLYVAIAAQQAR